MAASARKSIAREFQVRPFEVGLWVVGCLFWAWFVAGGDPSYKQYDWPLIHQIFGVIKLGFEDHRMPFYAAYFPDELTREVPQELMGGFWSGYVRFFAGPQAVISPQVLLLRVVSVKTLLIVHAVLLFTLGHWGLCALARKLRMNNFGLVLAFLFYNLGGYFTSKVAIGHLLNGGKFLWTCVLYLIWEIFDAGDTRLRDMTRPLFHGLLLAVVLTLVAMQGSTHAFFHMIFVVAVCCVLRWKTLPVFVLSLAATGILAAFRLVPAAALSGYVGADRVMQSGYGTYLPSFWPIQSARPLMWTRPEIYLSGLMDGLASLRGPDIDGWWELDMYVGAVGVLIVAIGLFWLAQNRRLKWSWKSAETRMLALALIFLAVSTGNAFGIVYNRLVALLPGLPVPERVPSRMVIVPLVLATTVGAYGFARWTDTLGQVWRRLVQAAATLGLAYGLMVHAVIWQVGHVESVFPPTHEMFRTVELRAFIVDRPVEPEYLSALKSGAMISACGWAGVACAMFYLRRRAESSAEADVRGVYGKVV